MEFGKIGMAVCFVGSLAFAGCGDPAKALGPLYTVKGKITMAEKPLPGAQIEFYRLEGEGNTPAITAITDDQGNYEMTSMGKVGVPEGQYRVCVEPAGEDRTLNPLFKGTGYGDARRSKLRITVSKDASAGAYDLKLVPGKKKNR